MRVLLTTDTIGGVWTFTNELSKALLNQGHSVALVSFGRKPSAAQLLQCAVLNAGFRSSFCYVPSCVPLEWMDNNEGAYSAAIPLLLSIAESFKPDLLHTSQFCFGAMSLPVPIVITAHSDVYSWAVACRPSGLMSTEWLARYTALVQNGLSCASAVVTPTRWMLSSLRQHFSFTAPSNVILNGRTLLLPNRETRIMQAVSVGRIWDEAKNIALLVEVKTSVRMIVAGEVAHPNAMEPVKTGKLEMLGILREIDVTSLFQRSSMYIAPSRYEPFGLAPLEAAQCGCALLLNDIPSFREVWGESALYFNGAAELGTLLDRLARSPDELREAQRRASIRAISLTGSRMTDEYLSIYGNLLEMDLEAGQTLGLYV